ncbi:MAG: hypothetical protein ACOYO1_19375 [Bacteroidales bacterium]
MEDLKDELVQLKSDSFRPHNWIKKIKLNTGYSESYIDKVFHSKRFNKDVALSIISLFTSEKKKLQKEIKKAKEDYNWR